MSMKKVVIACVSTAVLVVQSFFLLTGCTQKTADDKCLDGIMQKYDNPEIIRAIETIQQYFAATEDMLNSLYEQLDRAEEQFIVSVEQVKSDFDNSIKQSEELKYIGLYDEVIGDTPYSVNALESSDRIIYLYNIIEFESENSGILGAAVCDAIGSNGIRRHYANLINYEDGSQELKDITDAVWEPVSSWNGRLNFARTTAHAFLESLDIDEQVLEVINTVSKITDDSLEFLNMQNIEPEDMRIIGELAEVNPSFIEDKAQAVTKDLTVKKQAAENSVNQKYLEAGNTIASMAGELYMEIYDARLESGQYPFFVMPSG